MQRDELLFMERERSPEVHDWREFPRWSTGFSVIYRLPGAAITGNLKFPERAAHRATKFTAATIIPPFPALSFTARVRCSAFQRVQEAWHWNYQVKTTHLKISSLRLP